ncbi:hypothetical protein HXA34_20440 [Salipaludibacillus agaradhaerens]|jgi:hypothetical protein|uniref:hypothetical protein n=1 Tax=Salipaludibacillus agaradhaerens TaxID=76935 RepID=UPI002151F1EC|nr:hypothetical protein [Salipaludibacillus agaradhaerens]MCR6108667.1 hypothetical protein [Salipaludibacillus agaradhaerens]MCR6120691.1 hypothetical protein [Salipaludibacillus agaradhaerens]
MVNQNQLSVNNNAYYPSKQALSHLVRQLQSPKIKRAIKPGFIARTDGFSVDEIVGRLETLPEQAGLLSQLLSTSDLTEKTYSRFADNPNSLYNWHPAVEAAIDVSTTELKSPKTKVMRLPIELAQFIRIEYQDTAQHDKDLFNRFIFDQFGLEDDTTYFIKTGTFSSKFQFTNAKCSEPREMGEYFQVINNFAMQVGAGHSIDLVVREYIEDVENNPTIYNGMPLRTEFRVFVDCDKNELIGVVPYWHPIVMKRALQSGLSRSIQQDYQTYRNMEQKLVDTYNEYLHRVKKEIIAILPNLNLSGQYSIDVMKNGSDLYVIDLALMNDSALTELL